MIRVTTSGSTANLEQFLKKNSNSNDLTAQLHALAAEGVRALAAATPKDSGETAAAWTYEIKQSRGGIQIDWINTHENQGRNIAVLIQYGHGTRNGGYVPARDFINPAMRPVFDNIADKAWKVVTSR